MATTGQRARVLKTVRNNGWWTLEQIAYATGDPQPSISARLREFRLAEYGGYEVSKRRLSSGVYEYRLKKVRVKQPA